METAEVPVSDGLTDGLRPVPLSIDLNEIPSSSVDSPRTFSFTDPLTLVRRVHGNLQQAAGRSAAFPGEAGLTPVSACGRCRRTESKGGTMICDGCDRGFHLSCLKMKTRQVAAVEDWICEDCAKSGTQSNRWSLGIVSNGKKRGGDHFLDINSLPPFEGDREANRSQETSEIRYSDGQMSDAVPDTQCMAVTVDGSVDGENNTDGAASMPKSLSPQKRRHVRRTLSSVENQESIGHGSLESPSCEGIAEDGQQESGGCQLVHSDIDIPFQHKDFFILCFGSIDLRPTYHDNYHIWPVGYKTCWHDKITGSLFNGEVCDGGDSGPVFRIQRFPCSSMLIPYMPSVLHSQVSSKNIVTEGEDMGFRFSDQDIFADDIYQLILTDSRPLERDVLTCFQSYCSDVVFQDQVSKNSCVERVPKDEIGELTAEGQSTASAWSEITKALVNACCNVYQRIGSFQFCCEHQLDNLPSDTIFQKMEEGVDQVDKFCGSVSSFGSLVIYNEHQLESTSRVMAKWLDHDRFGFDLEIVREMIEQLPGSHSCTHYEFLSRRKSLQRSGWLLPKRTNDGKITLGNMKKNCHMAHISGMSEKPSLANYLPPGRPFSSRLPVELAGDLLQVVELLSRFYETLGLDRPLSFEELEKELVDPCLSGSKSLEKLEKELQQRRNFISQSVESPGMSTLSFSIGSGNHFEDYQPDQFIMVDMGSIKESSKASSSTHERLIGVALTKAHVALLKLLIGELHYKVASLVNPDSDGGDSKPRRGRKKDLENFASVRKSVVDMLPINELTWPDLARRYILSVLTLDKDLDAAEINSRECGKVFRCLQGDGGVLCGSLTGVAGMEADAMLLAEATKQIYCSSVAKNDGWPVEENDMPRNVPCDTTLRDNCFPQWAQALEPVRKLPTNVGTRIRKCVYDALEKGPPDWARKILEHSISKEVYKGNASGPTKKSVLTVLASLTGECLPHRHENGRKKHTFLSSDMIMKQCRKVLRQAAAADEGKVFCNLLGATLLYQSENEVDGILGTPAMVSRPLDFRTIDLKLAAGAYGSSHAAFLEDVREVWHNISSAYGDRSDLTKLADHLAQHFESLFQEEVQGLLQKCVNMEVEYFNGDHEKEVAEQLSRGHVIPKAPWEEGVCKVCGIDKDDESVLLCDSCDSEYHTYCLNPPLSRIPDGNWYCPSCVTGESKANEGPKHPGTSNQAPKSKSQGDDTLLLWKTLNFLVDAMEAKEYWELTLEVKISLLKFLCDETLNTAVIREHLDKCADMSVSLQQKLRSAALDGKNLKLRDEILTPRCSREGMGALFLNHGKWVGPSVDLRNISNEFASSPSCDSVQKACDVTENIPNDSEQQHIRNCEDCLPDYGESSDMKIVDSKTPGNDDHLLGDTVPCMNMDQDEPVDHSPLIISEQEEGNPLHKFDGNCGLNMGSSSMVLTGGHGQHELSGSLKTLSVEQDVPVTQYVDDASMGCHCNAQVDTSGSQMFFDVEAKTLKNETALHQQKINNIIRQLFKVSLRREFLGRDSCGRLYWILMIQGYPLLVAGGSMQTPWGNGVISQADCITKSDPFRTYDESISKCSVWMLYETEEELLGLVSCLSGRIPCERELKNAVVKYLRLLSLQGKDEVLIDNNGNGNSLLPRSCSDSDSKHTCTFRSTNAAMLLEKHYSASCPSDSSDYLKRRGMKAKLKHNEGILRCECLEPLWPARHHCVSCHHTFTSILELEGHNAGKCNSKFMNSYESKVAGQEIANSDVTKGGQENGHLSKRLIEFQRKRPACPLTLEEISKRFITEDSSKKVAQSIGLLGSDGIPSFVPYVHPCFLDPSLMLVSSENNASDGVEGSFFSKEMSGLLSSCCSADGSKMSTKIQQLCVENNAVHNGKKMDPLFSFGAIEKTWISDVGQRLTVPLSSVRPIVGKPLAILRQLKINLLDMEAAIPEEGLRQSRADQSKRRMWRAFVKSAESLFEMVQASIVFEDMIKTGYLRNSWWYWSSLTAAARTSTLAALALRIYSLDAAILYEKTSSCASVILTQKASKPGKKIKEMDE